MKHDWQVDTQAVHIIEQNKLAWRLETIPQSKIDVARSRENHARIKALDLTVVEDYADSMRRGDTFPCIVVAKIDAADKYIIAGGNHRHAAAVELGQREFLAIVIECDLLDFYGISKQLNSLHGMREDRQSRVAHAVEMVDTMGVTMREAAGMMRVSESSVSAMYRSKKIEQRLVRMGVNYAGVSASHLQKLHAWENSPDLLRVAIKYVQAGATTEQVKAAMRDANKLPNEASRIGHIQQLANMLSGEQGKRGLVSRPKRQALLSAVARIENALNGAHELCAIQCSREEAEQIVKRLKSSASQIGKLTQQTGLQWE